MACKDREMSIEGSGKEVYLAEVYGRSDDRAH